MIRIVKIASYLLSTLLIGIISCIRPLLGPAQCRYQIGCTPFAIDQLQKHTITKALWNIGKRIVSCSPLSKYHELPIDEEKNE